jgi:hypothetical protein
MTATSPESLALLGRAAQLRAEGVPRPDAATRLDLRHDHLRRLVAEHRRDYERLVRRARARVLREAADEAVATLRKQLHSEVPGVGPRVATTIVRYDLAKTRYDLLAAAARLRRGPRRADRRGEPAEDARGGRARDASGSTKVPNRQEVNAAKNVARPTAPPSEPAPTPKPAPVTPATAPAVRNRQLPLDDAARRGQRLVDDVALGRVPPAPLARGDRQTLEVDRLITGWLAEG